MPDDRLAGQPKRIVITGLGVVQGIISDHGGTIRINSELGLGTTVKIELPFRTRMDEQHSF